MSTLDVEALLESTAVSTADTTPSHSQQRDDRGGKADSSERQNHDSSRGSDRDRKRRERSRDRRRDQRDADGDEPMKSPRSEHGSANGSHRTRRRSRSRDGDRHRRSRRDHRYGDDHWSGGDYYRGGGRAARSRSRSRSPYDERYYRPSSGRSRRGGDDRDDDKRHHRHDRDSRRRTASPDGRNSKTPELNEDERDRRTIFVQQLAARLRTKDLITFFEKVGPVKEARIVKDRVSGRSKGYVFFSLKQPGGIFQTLTSLAVLAMSNLKARTLFLLLSSLPDKGF